MAYLSGRTFRAVNHSPHPRNSAYEAKPRHRHIAFEQLEPRFALAAGDLMSDFGLGGKATTDFPVARRSNDSVTDMARTEDGKYVLVGNVQVGHGTVVGVARLTSAGALDPTFGESGTVLTAISSTHDGASSVGVQSDGKIVVAGSTVGIDLNADFLVMRFNVDGSLDGSFGNNGVLTVPVGIFQGGVSDLLIQPDGKIIVAGSAVFADGDFAVARYLTDGTLDSTFGDGGTTLIDLGATESASSVALDSEGRLIIAGRSSSLFGDPEAGIVRLLSNGSLDQSFDSDGKQTIDFGSVEVATNDQYVASVQSDDRIVVGGRKELAPGVDAIALVRLTTTGGVDAGFGDNGEVVEPGFFPTGPFPILTQSDGRILVGVRQGPHSGDSQMVLLRYTADGERDAEFGSNGLVIQEVSPQSFDQPISLIIDADGGYGAIFEDFSTSYDFGFVRLADNGLPLPQFGDNGFVRVNFQSTLSESRVSDLTPLPDGKLLAVGISRGSTPREEVVVSRYLPNGQLDLSFGNNGKLRIGQSAGLLAAQVVPFADGSSLIVGRRIGSINQVFLAKVTAVGSLDPAYGSGGVALVTVDPEWIQVSSAVPLIDGSLIVVGDLPLQNAGFATRVRADGTVDPEFGENGIAIVKNNSQFRVSASAIQRDRKVLLAGVSHPQALGGAAVTTIVRLNANGSLDQSFGDEGFRYIEFPFTYPYPIDLGILRDGRILLTGNTTNDSGADLFAMRLLSNGDLDASFGVGGEVHTNLERYDQSSSVTVLDDGRFFLAGSVSYGENRETAVVGYLADGTVNSAFANQGLFTTSFSEYDDEAHVIRVLASGDLIIAGTSTTATSREFAVAKIEGFGVPQLPWHNYDNHLNVDGDSGDHVVASDAIVVIDALNLYGSFRLPAHDVHVAPTNYWDVNGDNHLTAADALMVIDYLNRHSGDGEAEAEGESRIENAATFMGREYPADSWLLGIKRPAAKTLVQPSARAIDRQISIPWHAAFPTVTTEVANRPYSSVATERPFDGSAAATLLGDFEIGALVQLLAEDREGN